tara:strand:+ start:3339 stop:4928 length:1590 start_codon:yes stop_codon:yes gene_type:complete
MRFLFLVIIKVSLFDHFSLYAEESHLFSIPQTGHLIQEVQSPYRIGVAERIHPQGKSIDVVWFFEEDKAINEPETLSTTNLQFQSVAFEEYLSPLPLSLNTLNSPKKCLITKDTLVCIGDQIIFNTYPGAPVVNKDSGKILFITEDGGLFFKDNHNQLKFSQEWVSSDIIQKLSPTDLVSIQGQPVFYKEVSKNKKGKFQKYLSDPKKCIRFKNENFYNVFSQDGTHEICETDFVEFDNHFYIRIIGINGTHVHFKFIPTNSPLDQKAIKTHTRKVEDLFINKRTITSIHKGLDKNFHEKISEKFNQKLNEYFVEDSIIWSNFDTFRVKHKDICSEKSFSFSVLDKKQTVESIKNYSFQPEGGSNELSEEGLFDFYTDGFNLDFQLERNGINEPTFIRSKEIFENSYKNFEKHIKYAYVSYIKIIKNYLKKSPLLNKDENFKNLEQEDLSEVDQHLFNAKFSCLAILENELNYTQDQSLRTILEFFYKKEMKKLDTFMNKEIDQISPKPKRKLYFDYSFIPSNSKRRIQ